MATLMFTRAPYLTHLGCMVTEVYRVRPEAGTTRKDLEIVLEGVGLVVEDLQVRDRARAEA